jgi:PAS domain S-box-containing protein
MGHGLDGGNAGRTAPAMTAKRARAPHASGVSCLASLELHRIAEMEAVANSGSWAHDRATGQASWSPGLFELLEVGPAALAPTFGALAKFIHPGDRKDVLAALRQATREDPDFAAVHRVVLAGGVTKTVLHRAHTTFDEGGAAEHTVGTLVDVTAEPLIRGEPDSASARMVSIWNNVPDGLILVETAQGTIVDVSRFAERALGRSRAELLGAPFSSLYPGDQLARGNAIWTLGLERPVRNMEVEINGAGGLRLTVEISTSGPFRVGERTLALASFRDVTLRKQPMGEAARVAQTMAAVVRGNNAIVRAESADELLRGVCEAIVGGPFCLAWVGEAEPDSDKSVTIIARAGPAAEYVDGIDLTWRSDAAAGLGPFGESVRTHRPIRGKVSDPQFAPWRERALHFGIHASLAIFVPDAERVAVFSIYSSDPDGFDADGTALFASLGNDIALALRGLRARSRHIEAEQRESKRAAEVEVALEGALAALAITLELRDPYTAGHQRRVADLASLIAAELSLDSDRMRGLFLAALVHDIGKVAIPVEIISKPGRLTLLEYEFVKQHSDAGHEILCTIPFHSPVAEIVRQHHEYLDGSGYPRGLRRDEILLEARILTVADIVEAMTAYRPYHGPASVDAAMVEIAILARTKLDPDVVAACARVVARGDFQAAPAPPSAFSYSRHSSAG